MGLEKASLESQIGNSPCTTEDTEEIFWLRETDDYQSRVALGNALAGQYRFKDAICAYQDALRIRRDDWTIFSRLAGAYLTIRRFDEAKEQYEHCLAMGADPKAVALPIGVWHYLKGGYSTAADWFAKCLPCGDEMAIAVIYWHTLCRYRTCGEPDLLPMYRREMQVGHHTAYRLAVSVFCGDVSWEDAAAEVDQDPSELNRIIALYGIWGYLRFVGETEKSTEFLQALLTYRTCWPCIAYLAAWNDAHTSGIA